MEFILPGRIKSEMSLTAPPSAYCKLLIPFAISRYYIFPGGSYLFQEIKESDFTIWQYHFFIRKPSLLYSYSSRPLLTLNYMLEGSVNCLLHGSGEIKLEENRCRLLYVPPDVKNEAVFTPGNFRCIHIDYSSAFLQKMAREHLFLKPVIGKENYPISGGLRAPSLVTRKIKMLLEEIISCRETEENRQLLFEARVRELLFIYIKDQDGINNYSNTKQSRIIEELIFYIAEHLDQDLSLSTLCRQARISKSALQKIFKDHHQKSIHRLIIDIRMTKAMELLTTTDLPIGEIAMLTNNKSFSYFSSSFTLRYGRPPSFYRKKDNYPPAIAAICK